MPWRVLVLTLALVVSACTSADDGSTPATTLVLDRGFELIEPVPDPSPIEASGDVRIGKLDNGLTYYVRSNGSPGLGLSLRLVVNAGSLQQEVPDSGAAHFLEHMLFNGTAGYPGNELDRALQRIGVQIGPDLNAYTSFDETVYELQLSTVDPENIDIGFSVLAEWASAATIDEQATIEERGVVREEIRLSDEGPGGAIAEVFDAAYFDGTPYEGHEPGGSGDRILATTADQLRTFYDRWYRPELMAVVAVGDLPVERLEREIRDRFDELMPRSGPVDRSEPIIEPPPSAITHVIAHPEQSGTFGSLDYPMTSWDRATVGGQRLALMQDLGAAMIENRLQDAVDLGLVELIDPFTGMFAENRNQTFLGFAYDAEDLAAASEFVLGEVSRVELGGFTDEEFERASREFESELDQILASAESTNDREYADAYVAHFLTGSAIDSAEDAHDRLLRDLRGLTASEITDLFRWELARTEPILIVGGPDPARLPTDADLDRAIGRGEKPRPATSSARSSATISELMARPGPTDPVEVNELDDLGGTEWVFANGVTVRFLSSRISSSQVQVEAVGQGGWSRLSLEDGRLAETATEAVATSGFGGHDRLTVRRFLADANASVAPFITETEEGFFGSASSDDLELLFQQLHLLVTAPSVDTPALREAIDRGEERRRLVETDVGVAVQAGIAELLHPGNERFAVAPPALESLTADRALDIYRQRFSTVDDLIVAVVGDIAASDVASLAARYLGSLPAGPTDSWRDVRSDPLADIRRSDLTVGSGESTGAVAVVYSTELEADPSTRVELMLLEAILNTRIFEQVREELAASYGGFVSLRAEDAPREGVEALFYANVDPDRSEEIGSVLIEAAADLAEAGPTGDEFERAYSVLSADFELTNNIELLDMLLTDPLDEALTPDRRSTLLDDVEPDDLQALAASIFPADVRVEVVAVPE